MQSRHYRTLLILALIATVLHVAVFAQEGLIPERIEPPKIDEEPEPGSEPPKFIWDRAWEAVFGKKSTEIDFRNAPLSEREFLLRSSNRWELEHGGSLPTTVVTFGPGTGDSREIRFRSNYSDREFRAHNLNEPFIGYLYDRRDLLFLSGDFTADDERWFKERSLHPVVVSRSPPKLRDWVQHAAIAQEGEFEEGIDKPKSEKTEAERQFDKRFRAWFSGEAFLDPNDVLERNIKRTSQLVIPEFPPTTFVHFGPGGGYSREILFQNSYWYRTFHAHDLNQPYIKDCYTKGDAFVLWGNVGPDDERWFRSKGLQYVIVSKFSLKRTTTEWGKAAALTVKSFKPDQAIVLNGLPNETGPVRSRAELKRMGLTSTPKEWRSARDDIVSAVGNIPIKTATKKEILKEFAEGSSNVLFVIAHSDSKAIFLPGLAGGKISMDEFDKIRRDVAPERVVVLLACKTGAINGETQSIAEALLKNRLASAVYASEDYIYATDLARMVRKLQNNGTLNQAFGDLRTIVELEEPSSPWRRVDGADSSDLSFISPGADPTVPVPWQDRAIMHGKLTS